MKAFIVLLICFTATSVFAGEVRLDAHKSEIYLGEQFVLDVIIHSEESLNAIEGHVLFPEEFLSVKEIWNGGSVINFWVEAPHTKTPGVILFSGITPGGFSGPNNNLFSVVFEAKKDGIAQIVLQGIKAFENDGLGTEIMPRTSDAAVSIKLGDSSMRKERLLDRELPEDFSISIENHPGIFDGKYFLVFGTQDKISGIAHYEVREGEWGWFAVAESPYLLKYQTLDRKIFVKAIDKAGNERVAVHNPQNQPPWYRQYWIFGILLVLSLYFLLKKLW